MFARACSFDTVASLSRSSRLLRTSMNTVAGRESRSFSQMFSRQHYGKRAFSSEGKGSDAPQTFLQRWMAPKEIPPRNTPRWYAEMLLICTVFAITGTSTMVLVRPAMSDILGLKGSLKDGPWSYRICSLVIMTPLYSILLVCVGTIFGRHAYFRHFAGTSLMIQ